MYFARACSLPEGAGVSTSRIHSSTIPAARPSTDCRALRTLRFLNQRWLKPAALRAQRRSSQHKEGDTRFPDEHMKNDTAAVRPTSTTPCYDVRSHESSPVGLAAPEP